VRVDIRRIAAIKEGDVMIGSRTKVKVVKNKVAAPSRSRVRHLYAKAFRAKAICSTWR